MLICTISKTIGDPVYAMQWRQRLNNFGGMDWRKADVSWGQKSPSGVQGRRPNRELVDEPPKLILILEMDVKLIFYGGKIENACLIFLTERVLQSCRLHDSKKTLIGNV